MLHLLIVDDEPLAVNYLIEALIELPHLDLDITKAYSGKEALAKLEKHKVDILLTDIHMPGMNGIELAEKIMSDWPHCRVIFLTGYNDFQYVQSALRQGGTDYVLKTEGDEVIIAALEKAITAIEAEWKEKHIMQKARQQIHLALPSLRRDYLTEFLRGEIESAAARHNRFIELDIDLDAEQPVIAGVGRVDAWGSFDAPSDHVLLFYSIHNIADEYFKPNARFLSFQYDRTRMVWLLQPLPGHSYEAAMTTISSCAERIQKTCQSLLRIPYSIALSARPINWEAVSRQIEDLKLQLTFRMGAAEEVLVIRNPEELQPEKQSSSLMLEIGRLRSNIHKLDLLEASMDNGLEQSFSQLYKDLFSVNAVLFDNEQGKWLGLELFSHMSAFFLTYLNKRKLIHAFEATISCEKIYNPDQHSGIDDMLHFFGMLGSRIAAYNGKKQKQHSHDLIDRVNSYIHSFLHEDLSLTRLAEIVYLSPPYLSRLYKQVTGIGLLEFINETRIQRAKQLLKTTDKKIHDIAAEVGFESAPYFTRLFRKKMGMTPLDYRDSSKGMEPL